MIISKVCGVEGRHSYIFNSREAVKNEMTTSKLNCVGHKVSSLAMLQAL